MTPRLRPLTTPRLHLPPHRPLSLLSSRPRLPPLLRPHPHPHPTRRLISAQTKAYLVRESLIAARIVLYGYTALLVTGCIGASAALLYTESQSPTPPSFPWRTRIGVGAARALTTWLDAYPTATTLMSEVVSELETAGWEGRDRGWKSGYISALKYLAELCEHEGRISDAQQHYQRIMDLPREEDGQWQEMKLVAALRVSKIAEFRKDVVTAEEALVRAVDGALPLGASLVGLPAGESTPLLVKAVTELGVFYARHGREREALELFTRVLAARRSKGVTEGVADPCAEAATMTYIGEVMFAMGDRRQGVAWTKEAFARSEELAGVKGACRECAIVAGRNVGTMLALMEEEGRGRGKEGRWKGLFAKKESVEESVEDWDKAVKELESIRTTRG